MPNEETRGNASSGGDGPEPIPPVGSQKALGGDGVTPEAQRRESALARLQRELTESEIEMPRLEGYSLRKVRKILDFCGFPLDRVKVRLVESREERGDVVRQRPAPGERIDLGQEMERVALDVAGDSLARWLPNIFQRSDISGRNFLKDFLWIFGHIFGQTEEKLDHLEKYFDALEAPAEFLPWLASWVALVLDEDWPEQKKRNIIKKAVELYQLRGTPRGLLVYLKLFTGVTPKLHENFWPFEGIQEGEISTIGVDTILMHVADPAYCFTVELPMSLSQVKLETIKKIHRIIEREKPAHTDYYVIFAPEEEEEEEIGFVVGERSTVGVDAWIAGGGPELQDSESAGDAEPDARGT